MKRKIARQGKTFSRNRRNKLNAKLLAYSVMAGGTLVMAQPADAAIVYSGIGNWTVDSGNTPRNIDLNGDTTIDFKISYTHYTFTTTGTWKRYAIQFSNIASTGASVLAPGNGGFVAKKLENSAISAGLSSWKYGTGGRRLNEKFVTGTAPSSTYTRGNFVGGGPGYIGVRFNISGAPHYGWIQYEGSVDGKSGTIIDWAYEDTPNTAILAGQKPSPPASVPTLNEWGMIILISLLAACGVKKISQTQGDDDAAA